MAETGPRIVPLLAGVVAPIAIVLTNSAWNYGGILLTIASIAWLGFAIVLLAPRSD